MQKEVFTRAVKRLTRALIEAEYRLTNRNFYQKSKITKLGKETSKAAKSLSEVFGKLEASECVQCNRCCTKAAMDSGYYSHFEREALINQGVNLIDYIVERWSEGEEPAERCLFLGAKGCNIPAAHRSVNCLSYVCHDRLGPQLVQLGIAKEYSKKEKKLSKTANKLKSLGNVPFKSIVLDFGNG